MLGLCATRKHFIEHCTTKEAENAQRDAEEVEDDDGIDSLRTQVATFKQTSIFSSFSSAWLVSVLVE